jgi:hypothetical protein
VGVDTRIHWPSPELVAMWAALSAIGLPAGRALDLGCGPGTEAMFLASMGWRRGTFQLVHDRLLLSNLWGDADDVYAREGRDHDASRLELIDAAAFALQKGGLFVLRMRQWSDAVEPFEGAGGRDTLERHELKHADRFFDRGPELGYLGFSTPDGASRALKRLSMSIQVWRRV